MTEQFSMNQLGAMIVGWGNDRGLNERRYVDRQFYKLVEEAGELDEGFIENSNEARVDACGDIFVVATIMCAQLGGSITMAREQAAPIQDNFTVITILGRIAGHLARGREDQALSWLGTLANFLEMAAPAYIHPDGLVHCVNHSWNVIKDRKGKMVDGVFIKEGE